MGTLCAFNLPNSESRDKLCQISLENGLHIGGCGENTVRFRPALIFQKQHVDLAIEILNKSLKQMY